MKKHLLSIVEKCIDKIKNTNYIIKASYYELQAKKALDLIEYYRVNFDPKTRDEMIEWAEERLEVYLEKLFMTQNLLDKAL